MLNKISTPGRLTTILPVIAPPVKLSALTDELGRQLVHNILVRKGMILLTDKYGVRLKPISQLIMTRNMKRLRAGDSPEEIVADLIVQLKLL